MLNSKFVRRSSTSLATLVFLSLSSLALAQEPVAPSPHQTALVPEPGHPKSALLVKEKKTPPSTLKQKGRMGVGLTLAVRGAFPVSFKYFIFDYLSLEVSGPLSHAVYGVLGIGIDADLLYEGKPFFQSKPIELAWQLGGGIELGGAFYKVSTVAYDRYGIPYSTTQTEGFFEFGLHANLGFQVLYPGFPFDTVLEWRPGAFFSRYKDDVAQTQTFRGYGDFINFGISARYYF